MSAAQFISLKTSKWNHVQVGLLHPGGSGDDPVTYAGSVCRTSNNDYVIIKQIEYEKKREDMIVARETKIYAKTNSTFEDDTCTTSPINTETVQHYRTTGVGCVLSKPT